MAKIESSLARLPGETSEAYAERISAQAGRLHVRNQRLAVFVEDVGRTDAFKRAATGYRVTEDTERL
jgi:hypothetical protein